MEKIFPPGWFNAMQYLLVHLPWEARVGGFAQFRWMYSQEKELKKLRVTMRNKARVEGCIAEAFVCKEITNFSSKYFSRVNNVNAHTTRYHIVEEILLSELSIFQWNGKGVGAPSAHYVTGDEWNYTMLYMYTNSGQPTLKQLDSTRQHVVKGGPSFLKWLCLHVIFCFTPFFISNCRSSIKHI
jgi:hypothetical protein